MPSPSTLLQTERLAPDVSPSWRFVAKPERTEELAVLLGRNRPFKRPSTSLYRLQVGLSTPVEYHYQYGSYEASNHRRGYHKNIPKYIPM